MKKSKKMRIFLRKVISIIRLPEMRILPGQLAFFLVISIIPLITLVGAIGSGFGLPATSIKEILDSVVPHDIINYLIPANTNGILNFNMIIFFGAAFILASNGTYSIINTSNEIYKVEDNGEIKKRLKAVLMTVILVILFLFLILVPAFGDVLIRLISTSVHNENYHIKI